MKPFTFPATICGLAFVHTALSQQGSSTIIMCVSKPGINGSGDHFEPEWCPPPPPGACPPGTTCTYMVPVPDVPHGPQENSTSIPSKPSNDSEAMVISPTADSEAMEVSPTANSEAMEVSPTADSEPSSAKQNTEPKSVPKPKVGLIVGGVIGGLAGLALLAGIMFFFLRRKRKSKHEYLHREFVATVLDKSGASSSISHAFLAYDPSVQPRDDAHSKPASVPTIYDDNHGTPVSAIACREPQLQQQIPAAPVAPAELQSREVDEDGVSVSSFDLQRPVEDRSVPRLPVYQRGTPPGSSAAVL